MNPRNDGRGASALVAEDDAASQVLATAVLEREGLHVTVVGDGAAAVEAWRSGHYDILFLDNHMPRMNGRDAATEIRAVERHTGRARTPIIGITASGLPEERNECLDAGMDALLLKPFRLDDLSRMLHRWLPVRT